MLRTTLLAGLLLTTFATAAEAGGFGSDLLDRDLDDVTLQQCHGSIKDAYAGDGFECCLEGMGPSFRIDLRSGRNPVGFPPCPVM